MHIALSEGLGFRVCVCERERERERVSERECVCLRFSVEGLVFSGLVFSLTPYILHLVRV
jgi:hypothetical protein